MNMKKTIGICATFLAALLCAVPQSVQATGKIRSVDVYDPDGHYTFPNAGNAMTVGDTVYVRFRLANPCWAETAANPSLTYPWEFWYTGTLSGNETLDQLQQLAAAKPRLGLWISGRVREAEYVGQLGTASDWLSDVMGGAKHYTDLIFKYTVQAGDLALPIQFANASGTGPATGEEPYYFKYNGQETQWRLECSTGGVQRVVADFAFGPSNLDDDPVFHGTDLSSWDTYAMGQENRDMTLLNAGAYIQALDFDDNYVDQDAGIWRTIAQGSTTAEPGAPALAIAGGAATPMDLYIWTADTNIAEIVKGGQVQEVKPYVFHDGVTRLVGKIRITAGSESVPFSVKATGATDATTQVFLAATPTNILNASGDIINNFLTRTVKVSEPLPPGINVTVNGKAKDTVTANADYATALVAVNVALSEAWPGPGDLTLPIKVTMKDNPALNVRDYMGMSETSVDDNLAWDDELTVRSGAAVATQSLWMYANRGTTNTEDGLLVEVDTNRLSAAALAFFTGKFITGTVVVNRSTPEITAALPPITDVEANSPKEITINVADAYGELRDPCRYTVYWSRSGGVSASDYVVIPNLAATASGDLTFTVTYPQKGDYTSRFYVENQDGKKSDPLAQNASVSVTVKAQKVIEATTLEKKFPEDAFIEQNVVTLTFGGEEFSMPNGETEGYIFFVPRNANASNLVDCSTLNIDDDHRWMAGYPVYAGETNAGPFQMTFLDGDTKGITMGYDIIVRTAEYWDEGTIVTSWNSKGFSFGVTNVVPEVTQVSMSGTRLKVNGGTMGTHASLNVSKTFTAQTTEPSDLDLYADEPDYTDAQKAFTTEWTFDYGNGAPDVKYVYGPPSTALTYAFTQAGNCTVTVRMCDKDMDHNRDVWGPEFTFTVIVDAKPTVSLSPFNGLTMFNETSIGQNYGKLNLSLSMVPTAEINVHLDVTRAGADDGNYPLPVLNTYDIAFNGSKTNDFVWFTALDGTAMGESQGYNISAVVTTTSLNADGVAWSNLYSSATLPVTIVNSDPEIMTRVGTNEIWKAENENFRIEYTMRDVPADVTHGLSVTWQTSEGFSTNYTVTATSLGGAYTTYKGSSPVFAFTSAGSKTITLLVEDKDGGFAQQQWRYYVVPSKAVLIYPRQPDQLRGRGGNLSALSGLYTGAAGLGDGRVWTTGSAVDFKNFIHKYTFDPTVSAVDIFARGYKVGDVDNGTLQPGPDITIDANGNHYKNGGYSTYYESKELTGRDSYFYCWILNAAGEGGGYTGSLLSGSLNPPVEVKGQHVADGQQLVPLPDYEADADSYPPTVLEAIFSKERYPEDNVGDINQDGIPDIYAVGRTYGARKGKLYDFATGNDNGGGTEDTASAPDLMSLTDFNGDEDYLPPATVIGGGVPNTADGWSNVGQPFTADLEVRGFHSGLNYRVTDDGKNYNVRGAWVSEPSFSPAESNAIVYMNKKLGIHEFIWPMPDPEDETEYAAAVANWNEGLNKDNSWIPENRTDPTLADTDGDGLPDGFEYYFWYQATVGSIDDQGEWKRFEGERFQLADIAKGVPIPADEVATLFNPTVKAEGDLTKRDSDNDGLTDLEEIALGTNPLHWDSDGDGMSDLWEVMRGMNPLKVPGPTLREQNLDNDFMASFTTKATYAVVTFTSDDKTYAYALADNGAAYINGGALADGVTTLTAIPVYRYPVYRYGGVGFNYTPINRGAYGLDETVSYLGKKGKKRTISGEKETWGDIRIATSKPLDMAEVDISALTFVSVETDQALRLVHDQVYAEFKFDPRTAWGMNVNGCVCDRWDPNMNPTHAKDIGEAGRAVNTAPYSNLDEYLILKYRYTATAHDTGLPLRDLQDDLAKIAANELTLAGVLALGTTNPNVPFEEVDYTVTGASSDSEGSSDSTERNSLIPTYTSKNHGADTDEDGVPDGWELYVMFNPNEDEQLDGLSWVMPGGYILSLRGEYAGTDSCNAYSNAVSIVDEDESNSNSSFDFDSDSNAEPMKKGATIYKNHPGKVKGWYNKFFPTDPWDIDTDGDGLSDVDEGATWTAGFILGRRGDQDPLPHTYTFIYGNPEDDGSLCIRGGGLNPCAVDTDGDLLPDPWEHDFAGVVFVGGRPWSGGEDNRSENTFKYGTAITLADGVVDIINRNDGINVASGNVSVVECYITAGMDGTFGPRKDNETIIGDAVTSYSQVDPRTGTKRNFDFDNDGLQNFQEYLVQTLRHLRYDDTETPLMGSYLKDGVKGARTYVKFLPMQAWDGAEFYKTAKEAGFTGLSARGDEGFRYRELGYFARPPKPWDPIALNEEGLGSHRNYEEYGYRVMLRPAALSLDATKDKEDRLVASSYASTDPRRWDSDDDGMDDYYELFHGLNPLLSGNLKGQDVIGGVYSGKVTAYYNAWVEGDMPLLEPVYDAMMYPWFMGVAEADADGDGLRNVDEALLVNTPAPPNYHTDPTPLWMTDSSALTSFTRQYYGRDLYMKQAMKDPDITKYFWFKSSAKDPGSVEDFMFSFEENEGYDTDHDWLPDGHELTSTVLSASDPLNAFDPDYRQALYLPGENAALISYSGDLSRPIGENYAMLRQFTVEAWIRPEAAGHAQTVLTRVCDYPGDTMQNAEHQVRANFRLGINDQGLVYGQFDSDDAVPSGSDFGSTTVLGNPAEWDVWTHVALTYNGSVLILYMNGREVNRAETHLIPANGIIITGQEVSPTGVNFGEGVYSKVPSRLIVGADAEKLEAMLVDDTSSWENYGSFYKGWIDEVRVWDGARTPDQIIANYKKSFSFSDISALRDQVYAVWVDGATRNANDGRQDLPSELLLCYNFRNIPSEVNPDYVASEPSGFTEKVIDNVKWNGHGVDLRCGWWSALPLASEVYANRALVPWIRSMTAALPAMDGSTPDSRYWSELLGGVTFPREVGVERFSFPNTSCPYPYWNYLGESSFRKSLLNENLKNAVGSGFQSIVEDVHRRFSFTQRTGFVLSADLLPLGGAFAKRCVDFWDGQGATDAWTATADDLDNDDLPDWWEALYAGKDGNPDEITPTTVITYDGRKVTAREAYFHDLAKGLLPGADPADLPSEYASTADRNSNGIPDWWESIYGISSTDAWSDADGDQLSDYVEWLIGFGFAPENPDFPLVSPVNSRSLQGDGQIVPDYFLRVGNLYLGGMFTDHDFMEDVWEVAFPGYVSTGVYDANLDPDSDGWSNFAECRAGTSPAVGTYLGVDEISVPDHPVPTVKVKAEYNGTKPVAGKTTIVQAWRASTMTAQTETVGRPDAVWRIVSAGDVSSSSATGTSSSQGGAKKTSTDHTKLLGMNPNREITITLGPGSVTPGSVEFTFKDLAWKWVTAYERNGVETEISSRAAGADSAPWVKVAIDRVRPGDKEWGDIVMVSSNLVAGAVVETEVFGEINYPTGETVIDLSKVQGQAMYDRIVGGGEVDYDGNYVWRYVDYGLIDLAASQVMVAWSSKVAAQNFPQTYYLADSDSAKDGVDSLGHLCEGKNIFVAFVDLDDDGAWTPGEPYGAAADVDVGWNSASCSIEMKDTTPQMARIDIAAAITASKAGGEGNFDKVNQTTDRGVVNDNIGAFNNVPSSHSGTNMPGKAVSRTKVRVVRHRINQNDVSADVVLERNLDLSAHPVLSEADLFGEVDSSGKVVYDLDWDTLLSADGGSVAAIESATYRIVIGDGNVGEYADYGNNLPVEFVNKFETRARQTPTVPDPALPQIVYAGQPTFRWSHTNSINKAYPAFKLKIYADDKSTVLYESEVQQAPARDVYGMYEWTAPVYAGMVTPKGKVFDVAKNYYWAVSMLDAKFTAFNNSETKTLFRLNTTGNIADGKGYGSIKVAVKYFGPLVGSFSTSHANLKNLIHVQAFTSPDFSGMPEGEAYVTDVTDIDSTSAVTVNAIIRGVPPGIYYIRAYVDSDGDFKKAAWETWGYGCYVGDAGAPFIKIARGNLTGGGNATASSFPYTPRGYKVAANTEVPVATVYMEDADTDYDGFPDAWEMENYGALGTRGPISGNTFFATVNPNLLASLSAYGLDPSVAQATAHLGFTLMGAALNDPGAYAAMSGMETTAVRIKSFSLEDGLDLEVVNESTADTGNMIQFNDTADVQLYLVCASSPDFSDAMEVPVKTITIRSNDTVVEAVTAEELAAARAKAPDACFFKVVIK